MALLHVLKPLQIGGMLVPNRVVRAAHGTEIGHGTINDDLIAYHVESAKGGVGLSFVEHLSVDPDMSPGHLSPKDPNLVRGYKKLVAAVQPYGMKLVQQLYHAGANKRPKDGSPPRSASDVPSLPEGNVPVAMTLAEIKKCVQDYADCAALCEEGGLDGVELHAAHSYLPIQFLSKLTNRRSDAYGGSLENRMRFTIEVMRALRQRVSKSFVVGVRIGPEMTLGGVDVEDCIALLKALESESLIDFADISMGSRYARHKILGGMHEPVGYELDTSVKITAAASVPTIVSGRIRTLEEADQVIGRGEASLVGMTRAHIADPAIVRKTIEGREDEIRACIACNHGCVGQQSEIGRLGCTINPVAGYERTLSEDLIVQVEQPKQVLVIGGGPAGMEAARLARLRGHKVILAEAAPELGGMLNIARHAPRRSPIGDIADWLSREIYRLGVDVRLSTYLDENDVRELAPDAVIVATGSLSRADGYQGQVPGEKIPGYDQPHVVTAEDVILGHRLPKNGAAIVFDDVGHYEAVALAEYLIEKAVAVTFVTSQRSFAPRLETSFSTEPALERLSKGKFRIVPRGRLLSIGTDSARIAPLYAPDQAEDVAAGLVVMVTHNRPNRDVLEALTGYEGQVLAAGDVQAPNFLLSAIAQGHHAGRAV